MNRYKKTMQEIASFFYVYFYTLWIALSDLGVNKIRSLSLSKCPNFMQPFYNTVCVTNTKSEYV